MNILIITGYLQNKPNFKNNTAFGSIKSEKMFMDFVAFGDQANEIIKYNTNDLLLIEGTLQRTKYNEKWQTQVKVQSVKKLSTDTPVESIDIDSESEIVSQALEDIDLGSDSDDDDLPF